MGSFIEINDTLQITKEQGFQEELNYEQHRTKTLRASDFEEKILNLKINQKSGYTNYRRYVTF